MKLLLNDKEIINFLVNCIDHLTAAKDITFDNRETAEQINNWIEKQRSNKKFNVNDAKRKLKDKLENAVKNDAKVYKNNVNEFLTRRKKYYYDIIHKNARYFINKFGEDYILELYRKSKFTGYIKGVGLSIDQTGTLGFRRNYKSYQEDCLFRNMDGNEEMLLHKMNNNLPFWFIDTGYTNFLNGKKKIWHRLVRNNLHHSEIIDMPVDRLGMFGSFPANWREGGDKILIIEPGRFSAKTFGIDIEEWKYNVVSELRQYTDKKIVIREKLSKKVRKSLYRELCDDDYYCVININSNAATEAIWAGVPAITLGRHISNSVTRNSIADINNLYRGPLAAWLAMLSYSQFTYDELVQGKAASIVRKYYA